MIRQIDALFTNKITQTALFLLIPAGIIADKYNQGYGYVLIFFIIMLIPALVDEYQKRKLYLKKNIAIPIVFNISNPADSENALNKLFQILEDPYKDHQKQLEKYVGIVKDDLIFEYNGNIFDEKRFIDFLKICKHDIKRLEAKIPENIQFHIIYIGPISNAILVGTLFGTEGVSLYQYDRSSNSYKLTIEIKNRIFKEPVVELDFMKKKIIGDPSSANISVAIDLSSHKVSLDKLQKPIIHLESRKRTSTLETAEEFLMASRDIYAVLNDLQQSYAHITLAYSMPTTVGFILGMNIQNYWDIELMQLDGNEYRTVVSHLNKIKYYY